MAGFELKEATLEGAEGEGFAVVLGQDEQQRCEGRIVFEETPGPDVMKTVVEGGQLTYEGPVYQGEEEYHKSLPVISQKADFEAENPYVDFVTVRSQEDQKKQQRRGQQKRQRRSRGSRGGGQGQGGVGEVTVHEK